MQLDLVTLLVVNAFVATLLGFLLLFAWRQNRTLGALAWWGWAFVIAGTGVAVLATRLVLPSVSIVLGNALVFASYGLLWCGCRVFEGKPVNIGWAAAGPAIWLAACAAPSFYGSFPARVALASTLSATLVISCAVETWRGRGEALSARLPIVIVLCLHAGIMLVRPMLLAGAGAVDEAVVTRSPWVTAHSFEGLVATIVVAFLFLTIAKERVEGEQRRMASRDPLTGILNRRAFVEQASGHLKRAPAAPAVLLLLDIDHFKHINDGFGHAAGDAVLVAFCRLAARNLPREAILGRLGGEEFGFFLPGASPLEGYYAAEYLRNAVALAKIEAHGRSMSVTVSIGLADNGTCGPDLDAMMQSADASLYRAKRSGRNRVLRGPEPAQQVA
jgi:diguanylate cyclase (GGDEF)-like protein